jgi:hypothetical protein
LVNERLPPAARLNDVVTAALPGSSTVYVPSAIIAPPVFLILKVADRSLLQATLKPNEAGTWVVLVAEGVNV